MGAPGHARAQRGAWPAAWQGQGVARECMAALVAQLFAEGARKLTAEIDAENHASLRLAEALGFTREALLRAHETTHEGLRDVCLYGLLASDPRPA